MTCPLKASGACPNDGLADVPWPDVERALALDRFTDEQIRRLRDTIESCRFRIVEES